MKDTVVKLTGIGNVSQLEITEQAPIDPGPGEVRIRQQAIGVNYIDIYHRSGRYALPTYPAVIGVEAAGLVDAVGAGVADVKEGDRVVYAGPPVGAYCSARALPADRVLKLPDAVSVRTAASSLLKGMTAYMLLQKTFPVRDGTTVLVHAAAGGLGSLLVRRAKALGAIVVGTVGTPEKAALATAYGADHLVVGRDADLVGAVNRLFGGRGVDVVYDGVGGSMLLRSLHAVRPFGMVASIGQVAGPPPLLSVDSLRSGKSLAHPSIMAWVADPGRYREAAAEALRGMETGIVAAIAADYPLTEVARAHADVESGRLAGGALLVPRVEP